MILKENDGHRYFKVMSFFKVVLCRLQSVLPLFLRKVCKWSTEIFKQNDDQ